MIEITKALISAQSELPLVQTDAENKHLKQKYATRGQILKTIIPVLSKHGLAILFPTSISENGKSLVSLTLHHSSGETMHIGTMPFFDGEGDKNPEQARGKSLTYSMRYLLNGLGVVTDEDADGSRERVPVTKAPVNIDMSERQDACLKALSDNGVPVTDEQLKTIRDCKSVEGLKLMYSAIVEASEEK